MQLIMYYQEHNIKTFLKFNCFENYLYLIHEKGFAKLLEWKKTNERRYDP